MHRLVTIIATLFALESFAASPAATQDWVRKFITTNLLANATYSQSVTNGIATITGELDGESVTITGEIYDRLALVVSNCTTTAIGAGVTNGMRFAWNGNGSYVNGNLALVSTPTNILFNGVGSRVVEGVDNIGGYFDFRGMKITASEARRLLGDETASIRRGAFNFLASLFVPSALGDTWTNLGDAWYTPKKFYTTDEYSWAVSDSRGNVAEIVYEKDGYGKFINNADEVIVSLSVSVKDLFKNVAGLSNTIVDNAHHLEEIDQEFEFLALNLDAKMAEFFNKIKNVETEDDNGTVNTMQVQGLEDGSLKLRGGIVSLAATVDGMTIVTNDGKIALANRPPASQAGKIPFWSGSTLDWFYLKSLIDELSLHADINTDESVKDGGIGIMGWSTQDGCEASLSKMLTDAEDTDNRNNHQLLTRYKDGNQNKIHYLSIGDIIPSGSGVLTIAAENDEGAMVEAVCTNKLTFASDPESNVRFTLTNKGNGNIEIKIGVFYK